MDDGKGVSKEKRQGGKSDMAHEDEYKLPQFVGEDVRQLDLYDILGVSIMVGCMFALLGGTETWEFSCTSTKRRYRSPV